MSLFSLAALFKRASEPLLGLDISSSSVKLVELSQSKDGRFVLERCAIETLERGWIADGSIENFDEVAAAVRRVLKKSGTKAKNVALALPPSTVITKKIVLPSGLSDTELELQVEAEASQYIPFPLEEVSLDFCVLGANANAAGDIDVLIAASRKEKVQDLQGLAESAGLKPVVVDVESYAARLAARRLVDDFPNRGQGLIVALFEMGALTTSMQVMRDEDVLYERDQAFGGSQLTQLIVRQYGFSLDEAESKKRSGDLPADFDSMVLKPFVESTVQEIGRALQFFFTSTPHHRVDHILLAGGSASVHGLTQAITHQLNASCEVIDPFKGMEMSAQVRMNKIVREAPSYLTACGLAMRRFLT